MKMMQNGLLDILMIVKMTGKMKYIIVYIMLILLFIKLLLKMDQDIVLYVMDMKMDIFI